MPKIINAFKSWVTRDIKRILAAQGATIKAAQGAAATITGLRHVWQPNYYEHVIRNETALEKIREYVQNNPESEKLNWDEFRQDYETEI